MKRLVKTQWKNPVVCGVEKNIMMWKSGHYTIFVCELGFTVFVWIAWMHSTMKKCYAKFVLKIKHWRIQV